MLTKGVLSFNFWVGEMLLGGAIPIIILLVKRFRQHPILRMIALAFVVGGVVAYRWDVNIAGQLVLLTYLPQEIDARYTTYIPSLIEFISGAGVIA
jgi:Ni/Fe-hydrogenase subunit HybB-like protein